MKMVSIGECMIEMNRHEAGHIDMRYAGDTLNAAVYFARAAGDRIAPFYMTALGDDPFSDAMIGEWQAEGIDTRYVRRLPGRLPGLYIIDNEADGERRVFYWRTSAAVRQLFHQDDMLLSSLTEFDLIYLSGITLAVLDAPQRQRLLARLAALRGKSAIAFDPNFRSPLWPSPGDARTLFDAVYRLADFLLVSVEDVELCYAGTSVSRAMGSAPEILDFFRSRCSGEIVLRRGPLSCLIHDSERHEIPAIRVPQVDTTGAGDAFNGTYLARRLQGMTVEDAAARAHRVAAEVVQSKGAITPRD